jgi:predicted pyridoxine 5'-phosphate oxidase superfamily flavin-nucleotide-binding protein
MSRAFTQVTFTAAVKELQTQQGSRAAYAKMEAQADLRDQLSEREVSFIRNRDGFYLASVNSDGWPYVQFRGGEVGFVEVVDQQTLVWEELPGNRQYLSWGNLAGNNRVMLFFMDYAHQRRLKVWGLAQRQGTRMEISVRAFDWNCSQHIPARFTSVEMTRLQQQIKELKGKNHETL